MIARFTVFDDRRQLCARAVDVGVPDDWDDRRVIAEAPRRLPLGLSLVDAEVTRVALFPDDDDGGLFADWRNTYTEQIPLL